MGFRYILDTWLNEGAWPQDRQKETLGATPASVYCPWTRDCWCGFRGTSCWHLPALSFICSPAFLQDLKLSHRLQESWLFPELFLTFSEDCLCIDLLCSPCWTNFPEGTSQFSMHGFFSEIQLLPILLRGYGCPWQSYLSILDIGEEFV